MSFMYTVFLIKVKSSLVDFNKGGVGIIIYILVLIMHGNSILMHVELKNKLVSKVIYRRINDDQLCSATFVGFILELFYSKRYIIFCFFFDDSENGNYKHVVKDVIHL